MFKHAAELLTFKLCYYWSKSDLTFGFFVFTVKVNENRPTKEQLTKGNLTKTVNDHITYLYSQLCQNSVHSEDAVANDSESDPHDSGVRKRLFDQVPGKLRT